MFAAQVWTYWFAPLLLTIAVLTAMATAAGYYRKVALPQYLLEQQRMLEQRQRRLEHRRRRGITPSTGGPERAEGALPQSAPRDRRSVAA